MLVSKFFALIFVYKRSNESFNYVNNCAKILKILDATAIIFTVYDKIVEMLCETIKIN